MATKPQIFTVRISATIVDEYASRCPDHIPEHLNRPGVHTLTLAQAHQVRNDAVFNADAKEGPEFMPPGTRAAYRALAAQLANLPPLPQRGRPKLDPGQRRETPVCTIRLEPQDAATLRALHRMGRLVPYLRRAARHLPPTE